MSAGTVFFFFNDTATTEIYTLSLHDALPISVGWRWLLQRLEQRPVVERGEQQVLIARLRAKLGAQRSEEHTSELQSRLHLVCRLLLEKNKKAIDDYLLPCESISYIVKIAVDI